MLTENPNLERAKLLFEQARYEPALRQLQDVLTTDPENVEALFYKAHVLMHLDRTTEAIDIASTLLAYLPDEPSVLDLKASALLQQGQLAEALACAKAAVELDPADADYWATLTLVHYEQKDYADALRTAEEGLRLEPGNVICLNMRTLCLTKLGRRNEVNATIAETLAEAPDDAFSHASAGWALLEKGDHQPARQHFAEALRLEPGSGYAQRGMLEAIKAKNPLFRLFLRYSFWISNQKGRTQWLFLIVVWMGLKLLRGIPDQSGVVAVVRAGLLLLIWLTWFVDPLFNVVMLFDRDGRYLLTDRQRDRYRYVAGLMGVGLATALLGAITYSDQNTWAISALLCGAMALGLVLPLSGWIEVSLPKNRRRLRVAFVVMAVVAGLGLLAVPFWPLIFLPVGTFMLLLVLYMLLRNFLIIQEQD